MVSSPAYVAVPLKILVSYLCPKISIEKEREKQAQASREMEKGAGKYLLARLIQLMQLSVVGNWVKLSDEQWLVKLVSEFGTTADWVQPELRPFTLSFSVLGRLARAVETCFYRPRIDIF
ncbi:hypothetical protein Sjap_020614 [Stephania japonica]|uniref:Uncharacterized protein n=1 Tax=Stephania japonica TaxID=461633 RepID=A0AAP0F108_9MAGN